MQPFTLFFCLRTKSSRNTNTPTVRNKLSWRKEFAELQTIPWIANSLYENFNSNEKEVKIAERRANSFIICMAVLHISN